MPNGRVIRVLLVCIILVMWIRAAVSSSLTEAGVWLAVSLVMVAALVAVRRDQRRGPRG
jgi:hypothetical protein